MHNNEAFSMKYALLVVFLLSNFGWVAHSAFDRSDPQQNQWQLRAEKLQLKAEKKLARAQELRAKADALEPQADTKREKRRLERLRVRADRVNDRADKVNARAIIMVKKGNTISFSDLANQNDLGEGSAEIIYLKAPSTTGTKVSDSAAVAATNQNYAGATRIVPLASLSAIDSTAANNQPILSSTASGGSAGTRASGGGSAGASTAGANISSPKVTESVVKITEGGTTSYADASSHTTSENSIGQDLEVIKIDKAPPSPVVIPPLIVSTCKVENMGINIEGIDYYSQGMPLINLSEMSWGWNRTWGSSWKDIELDLDEKGYLRTIDAGGAQTIISDDNWGRSDDNKRYVVLYDGEGELVFNLKTPKIIKSEPGRIEIELQKGRAGMAQISTNPANYLRNIRVLPIAHENDYKQHVLSEQFSDTWKGMGVVRYLNQQGINASTERTWQDRKKPGSFGTQGGQSLEDIIQMSNEMNINPWLLAPHMADDNYFRQMAIYVKQNLNSNLKVYIEYTNEAWNSGFPQTQYLSALAEQNGTSRNLEYGKGAKRLFEIWGDVFGGNDRLVRVIGTQFYNPWVSAQILKTPGLKDITDALAVGYYIGGKLGRTDTALETLAMSNTEVFDYLHIESLVRAKSFILEQKEIADANNLELIAYEAGQHLVAAGKHPDLGSLINNQEMTDKFISVNRDPRMTQLYMDMQKEWNEAGGGLIVWFATTDKADKWGSWGLLESMGQDTEKAPKYKAIQKMIANQGC